MSRYEITSPDGKRFEVTAPDGASQDEVLAYAQSQFAKQPERPINPVDGMSGPEKFFAGMGKGMVDVGRGVGQMFGAVDQSTIDESRRRDAPLMDTGSGTFGNIAGNIAALLPASFLPGANTVAGAAAIGGLSGMAQPTTEGENRLANAALGAALGGGAQYGLGKVAGIARKSLEAAKQGGAAQASQNAVKDATLREAQAAGYKVPPSQAGAGVLPRVLEGVSGKYKTNQAMAIDNQNLTNRLARQALGLPDDAPLTPETMRHVRKQAFERGYSPLANVGRIETDDAYSAALDNIVSRYQGAAQDFPGVAKDSVSKFVNGAEGVAGPRSAWVDEMGNTLDSFAEPRPPELRSLLDEIKRAGGISTAETAELGGGLHKSAPGLMRRKDGRSADGLLEWMEQNGWVSPQQIREAAEMPGGAEELAKDMIRSATSGERVIHPAQADAWYAYNDAMQEMADAGIKRITIPGDKAKGAGLRVKQFSADNAIKMTQILRDEATEAYRAGDKALGKAKKEAAKAIEDQLERSLARAGKDGQEALKAFREARKLMAKAHSVEGAIVEGGGQVNARVLGAALQRGKPLTDELKTIGAFANNFKDVARVPESGWAAPLTVLDAFGAAGMAGMGAGPASIALPAARLGARSLLNSPAFQRAAVKPKYGPGVTQRMTPKMLEELKKRAGGGLLAASVLDAE